MKIKKTIFALLLALVTLFGCVSAAAAEVPLDIAPTALHSDTGISPQAEETIWYTRYYNGKRQKRLWSITNQCWLTDWIDME